MIVMALGHPVFNILFTEFFYSFGRPTPVLGEPVVLLFVSGVSSFKSQQLLEARVVIEFWFERFFFFVIWMSARPLSAESRVDIDGWRTLRIVQRLPAIE